MIQILQHRRLRRSRYTELWCDGGFTVAHINTTNVLFTSVALGPTSVGPSFLPQDTASPTFDACARVGRDGSRRLSSSSVYYSYVVSRSCCVLFRVVYVRKYLPRAFALKLSVCVCVCLSSFYDARYRSFLNTGESAAEYDVGPPVP